MYNNLTALYSNGNNPEIKGRDQEINNIYLTLIRCVKPNVLLMGDPGTGKTSIVHQLSYLIANNLCPNDLKGFKVIEVNMNSLLSGDGYRGVTEKKFEEMIQASLKQGKCILFIDEFHTVENLGKMANGSTPGLGNTLKPYLTRGDFRIIGATTNKELKEMTDPALIRRFNKINVVEAEESVIKDIIKSCYSKYIGNNKITIKNSVINLTYNLSTSLDGINPDKAKNIVDTVVANAKLTTTPVIDDSFVKQTFNSYFKNLKKEEVNETVHNVFTD